MLFNFEGPIVHTKLCASEVWVTKTSLSFIQKCEKEVEESFQVETEWAEHQKRDALCSIEYGGVAQLGEHLLCKQGVNGSIPFISTRADDLPSRKGSEGKRLREAGESKEAPEERRSKGTATVAGRPDSL